MYFGAINLKQEPNCPYPGPVLYLWEKKFVQIEKKGKTTVPGKNSGQIGSTKFPLLEYSLRYFRRTAIKYKAI